LGVCSLSPRRRRVSRAGADAPPLPSGHAGEDAHSESRDGDADLSGLRSYQPGDPLQRVAWKAVARGAGWHTKHFEGGASNGPAELAWNALPHALDANQRIARLAAWVLAAERVARPFALHVPGLALPAARGGSTGGRRSRRSPCCRRLPDEARDRIAKAAARALRPALSAAQIRWLGVFLLATLLPQAPFVPIWVAGFGSMLVVLRMLLLARDRLRAEVQPARIPSWALALFALATGFAIRQSFGYFIGRDPCVAFLFVLAGIKYLEARTARDGTLLVCLASFQMVTPFFFSQSLLAALAAVPALVTMGATLQVLAQPSLRDLPLSAWRVRCCAPASFSRKGFRSPSSCSCCFPVLPDRCGGCQAMPARNRDCPIRWRRDRSASSQ
jgi:hypothetical protein